MDMTPDPGLHGTSRLLAQWRGLAREAGEPNCFYEPAMLLPALRHLARDRDVRLLEAWKGETLIGILPVSIASRYGRYPVRSTTNWVHRHCFFGAPLVRRGDEEAAWEQFLATLDGSDWAPNFLHLTLMDADGIGAAALRALCRRQKRGLREVHRYQRAMLRSDLSADAYLETNMRGKKRKEIRRLQKRLEEQGNVTNRLLTDPDELDQWCADFLTLEQRGWKGTEGTALACDPTDSMFFRDCIAASFEAGALMFLRLDLDGRPIAMLVNFLAGTGSFSFKMAFDEELARFSPGVLIELDNLRRLLDDVNGPEWMDSCAVPDHPMIDSLWAERRTIVQYRVALKGAGRTLAWRAVDAADAILERRRATGRKSKA